MTKASVTLGQGQLTEHVRNCWSFLRPTVLWLPFPCFYLAGACTFKVLRGFPEVPQCSWTVSPEATKREPRNCYTNGLLSCSFSPAGCLSLSSLCCSLFLLLFACLTLVPCATLSCSFVLLPSHLLFPIHCLFLSQSLFFPLPLFTCCCLSLSIIFFPFLS